MNLLLIEDDPMLSRGVANALSQSGYMVTAAATAGDALRAARTSSFNVGILDLGLAAAIEWQAVDFSNRTGVPCVVHCDGDRTGIDSDMGAALFSILRETLTNIDKHARATQVRIELENADGEVDLTVTDNGKGLAAADRVKPTSFGLRGMEERAAQLGGTVSVTAVQPQGTCIAVRVPHRVKAESKREPESLHGA